VKNSGTTNALAYAAYRRGMERYLTISEEGVSDAVAEFEKAQQLDPNYIDPIVLMAESEWILTISGIGSRTPQQGFEKATKRLQEAIELDSNHPAVIWEKGWIAMVGDWDWFKAKDAFRRAFKSSRANPDYYEGIVWYKIMVEGNYEEATDYLERGLQPCLSGTTN